MPTPFFMCERCDGRGEIDLEDGYGPKNCPVCDGEPRIDYATFAEYARQIDVLVGLLYGGKDSAYVKEVR